MYARTFYYWHGNILVYIATLTFYFCFLQSTPISIAFLKGHLGIVDYLLKQAEVDINFRNDEGKDKY